MQVYLGKSVSGGITKGKIKVISDTVNSQVEKKTINDVEDEIYRVNQAMDKSKEQLTLLSENLRKKGDDSSADIMEAHVLLVQDSQFIQTIYDEISNEKVNAEYAVMKSANFFSDMFAKMDDEYMSARAADFKDIAGRIINNLEKKQAENIGAEAAIIVADDLTPSQTAGLKSSEVLGFVTREGSIHSHTAIIAKNMGIPALVCCENLDLSKIYDGMEAILDGNAGKFYISPTIQQYAESEQDIRRECEEEELTKEFIGKPDKTKSGKILNIYANIAGIADCENVIKNDARGVGLLRSEFLYLKRADYPSEEELFTEYKKVIDMLGDRTVVIRTLDIGADKKADYFQIGHEDNPAMGYRAIRICLNEPEVFKTQLRAIFRVASYGNVKIMYPMITSVTEIREIERIVDEVENELTDEKISYRIPEQGIMIETPAAVMISEELAEMVDFFSIGTNDLTQYTLAIDRQNSRLDRFYEPHHKAVMRMIKMVIENAHKKGITVGICGGLGADETLLPEWIKMGLDEISVPPVSVLRLRKKISEIV